MNSDRSNASSILISKHKIEISAFCAGIISTIYGYPLDNIKTRMQSFNYSSFADCARQTYKSEGIRGFVRGIMVPLFTVGGIKMINFSFLDYYKRTLIGEAEMKTIVRDWEVLKAKKQFNSETLLPQALFYSFIAGSLTGVSLTPLTTPLEVVKVQTQLQKLLDRNSTGSKGNFRMAMEIYKKKGTARFFKAFWICFTRDGISGAAYYGTYEYLKYHMLKEIGTGSSLSTGLINALAGGFAGSVAWISIFPLDVIKTNIQKDALSVSPLYKNARTSIRLIYAEHGISGFFKGLMPTLIRSFPVAAINFFVYEKVLEIINHYDSISL